MTAAAASGVAAVTIRGFPQLPQYPAPSSNGVPQLQAIIWFTYPSVVTLTPASRRGNADSGLSIRVVAGIPDEVER
jgi:hypothetical protein